MLSVAAQHSLANILSECFLDNGFGHSGGMVVQDGVTGGVFDHVGVAP